MKQTSKSVVKEQLLRARSCSGAANKTAGETLPLHSVEPKGNRGHKAAKARRQGHWPTVSHAEEQEMQGWEKERANFYIYFNLYLKFFNTHFLDYLFCNFSNS